MNTQSIQCHKCSGTGNIGIYKYTKGGVCFLCNGKGSITTEQLSFEVPVCLEEKFETIKQLQYQIKNARVEASKQRYTECLNLVWESMSTEDVKAYIGWTKQA